MADFQKTLFKGLGIMAILSALAALQGKNGTQQGIVKKAGEQVEARIAFEGRGAPGDYDIGFSVLQGDTSLVTYKIRQSLSLADDWKVLGPFTVSGKWEITASGVYDALVFAGGEAVKYEKVFLVS